MNTEMKAWGFVSPSTLFSNDSVCFRIMLVIFILFQHIEILDFFRTRLVIFCSSRMSKYPDIKNIVFRTRLAIFCSLNYLKIESHSSK